MRQRERRVDRDALLERPPRGLVRHRMQRSDAALVGALGFWIRLIRTMAPGPGPDCRGQNHDRRGRRADAIEPRPVADVPPADVAKPVRELAGGSKSTLGIALEAARDRGLPPLVDVRHFRAHRDCWSAGAQHRGLDDVHIVERTLVRTPSRTGRCRTSRGPRRSSRGCRPAAPATCTPAFPPHASCPAGDRCRRGRCWRDRDARRRNR